MTDLCKAFIVSLEARKAKATQEIEHHERCIKEAKAVIKDHDAAIKLMRKLPKSKDK